MNGEAKVFLGKGLYNIHFKEAGILLKNDHGNIKIPKDWMESVQKLGAKNRFVLNTTDGAFVFQIKDIMGMVKKRDTLANLIYEKYIRSEIPEEGWD